MVNECLFSSSLFPPPRAIDGGGNASDGDVVVGFGDDCEDAGAGDRGGFCGPERVKALGRHGLG